MQIYHTVFLLSTAYLAWQFQLSKRARHNLEFLGVRDKPLIQWIWSISFLLPAKPLIKYPGTRSQKLLLTFQGSLALFKSEIYYFNFKLSRLFLKLFRLREDHCWAVWQMFSVQKKPVMSRWFHIPHHLLLKSLGKNNSGLLILNASYLTTNLDSSTWLCKLLNSIVNIAFPVYFAICITTCFEYV